MNFKPPTDAFEALDMQYRSMRFTTACQLMLAKITNDPARALEMADEMMIQNQADDLPTVINEAMKKAAADAQAVNDEDLAATAD